MAFEAPAEEVEAWVKGQGAVLPETHGATVKGQGAGFMEGHGIHVRRYSVERWKRIMPKKYLELADWVEEKERNLKHDLQRYVCEGYSEYTYLSCILRVYVCTFVVCSEYTCILLFPSVTCGGLCANAPSVRSV